MTNISLLVPFNLKVSVLGSGTFATNLLAFDLMTLYALVISSSYNETVGMKP